MSHGSEKAVITAVIGNGIITIAKFTGYAFSGSSALFAEAVHSLADTSNQCLLLLGLKRSQKEADDKHHFGYGHERYFWNLISAVTIFFLGCVYTIMHAIEQYQTGHQPEFSTLIFGILFLALLIEGYSFLVAYREFNDQRKKAGSEFMQFFRETRDPTTLAVLIEDAVAVLGLLVATLGIGLSYLMENTLFDMIAAIVIGLLMGGLALFLAATNRRFLLNTTDEPVNQAAKKIWGNDPRIQNIHKLRSIVLSPEESLVMAEIELREESMFGDMDRRDIQQAIYFMKRLDDTRRSLEENLQKQNPNVRQIYVEFGFADLIDSPNQKSIR